MITWQDLEAIGEREEDRMSFIRSTINQYKSTSQYAIAEAAKKYMCKESPDMEKLNKMIYTATGQKVRDEYSSDYKIGRAFFPYFVTQQVQYLLSNGITWEDPNTAAKLGTREAPIDTRTMQAAKAALWGAVSYGFWNLDHVEVFSSLEFCPLFDEENGTIRAGIRWWQIDGSKPFRATLYEEDGYTEYIWNRKKEDGQKNDTGEVLHEKRPYKITIKASEVDGEMIRYGENYPEFPIVPMWSNAEHVNELTGIREQIFAYDVTRSGFVNNVEDASYIYWGIHNAPSMMEHDLVEFLSGLRRLHIAKTEDMDSSATPHQLETPYQAREALLDRLERDIFKDAMAFDPERVASGAATATEIKAAYTNLRMKTNSFEYQVISFLNGIMKLAGVDDNPTFTRDMIINENEMIQTVLSASQVLGEDYVTKKILTILGDGDQAEEMLQQMEADEIERWENIDDGSGSEGNE